MNARKSLLALCGLVAVIALSKPVFAVVTGDNANIGTHPSYGSGYAGFWYTGQDYALLQSSTGKYVYINSSGNDSGGGIMFRYKNAGLVRSPDGGSANAYFDDMGNLVVGNNMTAGNSLSSYHLSVTQDITVGNIIASDSLGNTVISASGTSGNNNQIGVKATTTAPGGYGVYGSTTQSDPSAGVYGTSTATNSARGVVGIVTGTNSIGVRGTTDVSVGVQGEATSGVGVLGYSSAANAVGTEGYCDGTACNGVYGFSVGINGLGVYGGNNASSGYGVYGDEYGPSNSGSAVYGIQRGSNNSGWGVVGTNTTSTVSRLAGGVLGTGNFIGVFAESTGSLAGTALIAQLDSTNTGLIGINSIVHAGQWGFATTNGNIHIGGNIAEKTGGGSWSSISDERVKKNIVPFSQGLEMIEHVKPISFQYNGLGDTANDGKTFVGVKAQDVEVFAPQMVSTRRGKLHPTDTNETDIKVVDPSNFTYALINSVKELSAEVKDLQAQVKQLKAARK
jgi:trimeric autotransporter adhesin